MLQRMPAEEFRGVTLFAVLPGPLEPLQTLDALIAAARGLARELSGMVQDAKGMPLSPQRAAALRDDVARFQAHAALSARPRVRGQNDMRRRARRRRARGSCASCWIATTIAITRSTIRRCRTPSTTG